MTRTRRFRERVTNESVSSQRIFDGDQHRVAVLLELRGADAVDESQLGRRCRECERDAFDRGVMEHHVRGFAVAQLLAAPGAAGRGARMLAAPGESGAGRHSRPVCLPSVMTFASTATRRWSSPCLTTTPSSPIESIVHSWPPSTSTSPGAASTTPFSNPVPLDAVARRLFCGDPVGPVALAPAATTGIASSSGGSFNISSTNGDRSGPHTIGDLIGSPRDRDVEHAALLLDIFGQPVRDTDRPRAWCRTTTGHSCPLTRCTVASVTPSVERGGDSCRRSQPPNAARFRLQRCQLGERRRGRRSERARFMPCRPSSSVATDAAETDVVGQRPEQIGRRRRAAPAAAGVRCRRRTSRHASHPLGLDPAGETLEPADGALLGHPRGDVRVHRPRGRRSASARSLAASCSGGRLANRNHASAASDRRPVEELRPDATLHRDAADGQARPAPGRASR